MPNPAVFSTSVPYQLFCRAVSNTSASTSVSDFKSWFLITRLVRSDLSEEYSVYIRCV